MLTLKISLGIFFLRTLVRTWHKYIIRIAVAVSSSFGVVYFFFSVFQCGFFKDILDFALKRKDGHKCVTPLAAVAMGYTSSAIAVVTDITFVMLPIVALQGTQMSFREKGTVIFILALAAM